MPFQPIYNKPQGESSGFQPLYNVPQSRSDTVNVGGVPISTQQREQQIAQNLNPVQNFGVGLVKGALSTIRGAGELGSKIGNVLLPKALEHTPDIYNPQTQVGAEAKQRLEGASTGQDIGKATEQFAEFFIPAAKAAQAENYVNLLSKGIASKPLGALARILGKGIVQGATTAGVVGVQTGGDLEKTKTAGLTAGILRSGFATIGEGARALKLPERFYSTIFKNSYRDMKSELSSEVVAGLQKTNPEKYQKLVDSGIIKTIDGQPIIDDTIAKQALDRGLRGNIRGMAKQVIQGTFDSEAQVQGIAKNATEKVSLAEPQFKNILDEIAGEYENVGFGEIADEAKKLSTNIVENNGQVSAEVALSVRRLLDRARIARSFDVPANKLSLSQANLKALADKARGRVNEIPGMNDAMKEYSFNIEALEVLAKEAARRGNNQALSLIDSLFLSSAFSADSPIPGMTAGIFRKYLMSGPAMTGLGQAINKETGTVLPGVLGGVGGITTNLPPQSE